MKNKITIIDFGAGNLHSVQKAFKYIGVDVEITNDKNKIKIADKLVFPGVGAFGAAMKSIRDLGLEEVIKEEAISGKPFLGICIGMQVLFEGSEENKDIQGLGVIEGRVVRFKKAKVIPHIGWNDITFNTTNIKLQQKSILDQSLDSQSLHTKYYFVHSYYACPKDESIVLAQTEYEGESFTSIIKKGNLMATQFHPEKSGEAGLELLKKFIA